MPTVPIAPGVPPLTGVFQAISIVALVADIVSYFATGPQWGIFLNGVQAIKPDSVVDFTYKSEYTLSDYPVEQGAFQTYDKVQVPYDVRLRLSAGGSASKRQTFMTALETLKASLSLYTVMTPEFIYPSVNFTHIDYKRTATNGVGLIVADVWGLQVRQTATTAFSNTKSAAGASPVSNGTVQPVPPTNSQSALSSLLQ